MVIVSAAAFVAIWRMLHELPLRMGRNRWGRRLLLTASIAFVGHKVYQALGPVLPKPHKKRFPWGVFSAARSYNTNYRAWGETADGERVCIDLHRWFTYTRGFTRLYVFQEHRGIRRDGRDLRAFGRWLAHRIWKEDKVKLERVHFEEERIYVGSGRRRVKPIAKVRIRPRDYERSIPQGALVNR